MNPTSIHWDVNRKFCTKHKINGLPCAACLAEQDPNVVYEDPKSGAKLRFAEEQPELQEAAAKNLKAQIAKGEERWVRETEMMEARLWARSAERRSRADGGSQQILEREMTPLQRRMLEEEFEAIRKKRTGCDIAWGEYGDGYWIQSEVR